MLGIVVQGPIFQGNLIETATYCRHWRELFPSAHIVFAVSVTDILTKAAGDDADGQFALLPRLRHDGHLQAALRVITESCDAVASAEPALPLPAIKSDRPDKLNNMNLQLAAAQTGLALVQGEFVLRTRSDLIFLDRSFLAQAEADRQLPRGDAATLAGRVLISPFYTLNPFTLERMPLHFSDWFHFGLLEDVRRIWAAPPVTLADSIYYKMHPHAAGSSATERMFNTRLAVEQHILYHCFRRDIPDLKLDFHNDLRSVDRSLDILADNFSVCDLVQVRCLFNKYASEFSNPEKLFHCITREDWLAMVAARSVPYSITLAHRISEAEGGPAFEGGSGLPRTYPAVQLRPKHGRFLNGEIVGTESRGTLFFGPYLRAGPGRYLATANMTSLEGLGSLNLRVTHGGGDHVLAETKIERREGNGTSAAIAFEVPLPGVSKLEVVCDYDGFRTIACSGVSFTPAPVPLTQAVGRQPSAAASVARTPVGKWLARLLERRQVAH